MATLDPYPVLDFSGGVRKDKSDYQKQDNELVEIINFDIDEVGRATKRFGSQQYGTELTNNVAVHNTFYWERWSGGNVKKIQLVNNRAVSGDCVFQVVGSRLDGAITTSTTTISLQDASDFTSSGKIEIEGDIIDYTGKSSNDLTGVTNITSNHPDDAAVHQTNALSGSQPSGTQGIYYAVLNNLVFVQGPAGAKTFDGSTLTDVSDSDEPNAIFATTYRQRIHCADPAASNGNTIHFSDPGDPTSWTATNNFTVEDSSGEVITGIKATPSDELLIFKNTSTFAYNEVTLKQRSARYGAYNHMVPKEINGLIYSFGPNGVFVTNGSSFQKISQPIDHYLKHFVPNFDTTGRIVINTGAAVFDNKYMLFTESLSGEDPLTMPAFIYDTETETWSIYEFSGLNNMRLLKESTPFLFGSPSDEEAVQAEEGLFLGNNNGQLFRLFSKRFNDSDNEFFSTSGDIFKDLISNTGTAISARVTTKFYDQRLPYVFKKYTGGGIRILAENIGFHVSIRIETERGLTDWISLGTTTNRNHYLPIPRKSGKDLEGYRIAFKISHADSNIAPTLNGIIIEDVTSTDKRFFSHASRR